jgi:hypothetical protein
MFRKIYTQLICVTKTRNGKIWYLFGLVKFCSVCWNGSLEKKSMFCVGKMNSLQYSCPIKSEPITECINSILLTNAVADLYLTKCSPKYMLGEY